VHVAEDARASGREDRSLILVGEDLKAVLTAFSRRSLALRRAGGGGYQIRWFDISTITESLARR